jgi:ATP-binding cassette subfamily B protein
MVKPLLELIDYAGDKKRSLYASVSLATIGEIAGMVPYLMVILIVNDLIAKSVSAITIVCCAGVAIVAMLARALLTHRSSVKAHMAAFTILQNIRIRIAEKMLRVPLGVMIDTPSGSYKNLMIDRVSKLEDSLAHYLPEIVSCLVAPILSIAFIFTLDWRMGIASLASILLGLIISTGMIRDSKGRMQIYSKAVADMNNATVEYVSGIEVIKTYNRSDQSYGKFSDSVRHFHASTMDWWRHSWGFSAAAGAVFPSTFIGTVPVGGYLLMIGDIKPSVLIACMVLPIGFVGSLIRAVTYSQQFAFVGASLAAIREFLQTEEQKRPTQRVSFQDYAYEFDAVSFSYHQKKVLKKVSFKTIPGGVTALVGPSGAGKSTIAKLMAGLWDPE